MTYKTKSKTINKTAVRTYISIIILNVNGLKAATKRHRLAEWIQKQDPCICCLHPLQTHGHIHTKSEGMEKDTACKWKFKKIWSGNAHIKQNRH